MARLPRFVVPGQPQHLIQRGIIMESDPLISAFTSFDTVTYAGIHVGAEWYVEGWRLF